VYIAIEGLQGTGKSTLVSLLQSWLAARSIDFDLLCPNQPMANDHWLEQKALLPQFSERDEFRELLLTTRAKYHKQRVDFKKHLVIGDQSIFSKLVAHWDRSVEFGMHSYVNQVFGREFDLPWPDHVVMLTMPISILCDRLVSNHNLNHETNAQTIEYLITTQQAFVELENNADILGFEHVQWHHTNANQPFNDLVECIGSFIVKHLEMPHKRQYDHNCTFT
jgi:thymidylate kinase